MNNLKPDKAKETMCRLLGDARKALDMVETNFNNAIEDVPCIIDIPSLLTQLSIPYLTPERLCDAEQYAKNLETLWPKIEAQHQQNLPLIENNKRVKELFELTVRRIGLPVELRNGMKRNKVEWYPWMKNVLSTIPTTDWYESCVKKRDDFMSDLKKLQDNVERAKREREREEEMQKRKIIAQRFLGFYAQKYGCQPDANQQDIIIAIISRDKYLHLAHWLCENRNDWSDGYSNAEIGLNGFDVETTQDKEVSDSLWNTIANWDGDGRIFRDCAYCYDDLYSIAKQRNAELYEDYCKVKEHQA